ncbi:MAG: hypothetical protein NWR47_07415, partial [Aestuariivirgaceae bacterium]|nr:hypothetical protein [Aestuariivirgaceae bacterium]
MRDARMLEEAANDLIHRLCRKLARAGCGATRLAVKFFRADGTRAVIQLGMSRPSQDPLHMMRLLRPKLDALDAGFGIDAVNLEAEEVGPAESEEPGFMEGTSPFHHDFDVASLSDRLSNRASEAGLARLSPFASHMPER